MGSEVRDIAGEHIPGNLLQWQALTAETQGGLALPRMAQHVLGIVEARAGKPFRSRHLAATQGLAAGCGRLDVEEVPHGAPEPLEIVHRPGMQGIVVRKIKLPLAFQPAHEAREFGFVDTRRAGSPEQFAFQGHGHEFLCCLVWCWQRIREVRCSPECGMQTPDFTQECPGRHRLRLA